MTTLVNKAGKMKTFQPLEFHREEYRIPTPSDCITAATNLAILYAKSNTMHDFVSGYLVATASAQTCDVQSKVWWSAVKFHDEYIAENINIGDDN